MKLKHTLALGALTGALTLTSVTAQAGRMDGRIEKAAKNSYVFQTYLKDDSIHVKSTDGAVTLTGSVADDSQKALAGDTVSGLPGVVSVDNQLQVNGSAPMDHTDKWIELKVKAALLFHRNVSAETKVIARNGVVILQGVAASPEQKDLTGEYARDVDGVVSVQNDMTVGNTEPNAVTQPNGTYPADRTLGRKVDDASITAEVKMDLLSHRSTSASNTKVTTRHGVVTLTGVANSAAQKDLTGKVVSDIDGVRSVVNDIRVEPSAQ